GHRVRLAGVPLAVLLEETPIDRARERTRRISARLEVFEVGEHDGELAFGDGDGLVVANRMQVAPPRVALRVGQVDGEIDGNGFAPVALPREHPVAQLVIDLARSHPDLDEAFGELRFHLARGKTGERPR